MTDRDAMTTFLVCFTGRDETEHRTGLRICLGVAPTEPGARAGKSGPYFLSISLSNVRIQLPNPLPGTHPISGTTNLEEMLPLSAADIANLRAWLDDFAPPVNPKD